MYWLMTALERIRRRGQGQEDTDRDNEENDESSSDHEVHMYVCVHFTIKPDLKFQQPQKMSFEHM